MTVNNIKLDIEELYKAYKNNEFSSSIKELSQVKLLLNKYPGEVTLFARIARVAMQGRLEKVLWRWGMQKQPCNIEILKGLAHAYHNSGRVLDAEKLLYQALDLAENDDEKGVIWAQLGSLYGQLRRFSYADKCFEKALIYSNRLEISYDRGYCLLLQEKFEESKSLLLDVKAFEPKKAGPYVLLARIEQQKQEWMQAKKWLEEGVQEIPEHPLIWYHLAISSWSARQYEQFLGALDKVESISPEAECIPGLRWLKANIFYNDNKFEEAHDFLLNSFDSNNKNRFLYILKEKDLKKEYEKIVLNIKPQLQRQNHCVPCSVSIILEYWQKKIKEVVLAECMMEKQGTPMDNLFQWFENNGFSYITLRPDIEQVKDILKAGIPLLMNLNYSGGAHVNIIYGFDDAIEGLFVCDPGNILPEFIEYNRYGSFYANTDGEALVFVPPGQEDKLYQFKLLDEPDIRKVANCQRLLSRKEIQAAVEIIESLEKRNQEQVFYYNFKLDLYPDHIDKDEFEKTIDFVWNVPQQNHYFRLKAINNLIRADMLEKAREYLNQIEFEELGWYGLLLQAKLDLFQNNLSAGKRVAEKALRLNPHFVELCDILGQIYLYKGSSEEAELYFNWALELDPGKGYLYSNLAENFRRQGKHEEANRFFKQALAINPYDGWSWGHRGLNYCNQKRFPKASRCLKMAIKKEPHRSWNYEQIARVYEEWTNDYEKAEEWLRKGIAQSGNRWDLLGSLGRIIMEQERYAEAIPFLQQALELSNETWPAPILARCLLEEDLADEAWQVMIDAMSQEPDSTYLFAHMGYLCWTNDRTDDAINNFFKALMLEGNNSWPLDCLVDLCVEEGKEEKGITVIEEIIDKHGANADLICSLGYLWECNGNTKEAMEKYQQALAIDPKSDYALYRIAEVYRKDNDWTAAEKKYKELLEKGVNSIGIDLGMTKVYLNTARFEEAEKLLKGAVKEYPEIPIVSEELWELLLNMNKPSDMEPFFAIIPLDELWAAKLMFRYLVALGKMEQAEEVIEKLIELYSDDSQLALMAAGYYEEQGKLEKAEIDNNKAFEC